MIRGMRVGQDMEGEGGLYVAWRSMRWVFLCLVMALGTFLFRLRRQMDLYRTGGSRTHGVFSLIGSLERKVITSFNIQLSCCYFFAASQRENAKDIYTNACFRDNRLLN